MIDEHMVMAIADRAFARCQNLLSVKLPTYLQTIGSIAFSMCPKLTSISIPANVTSIGEGAFSYGHFKEINVESGNTVYSSEDGVLYNYSKTKLITFPTEKELDDFLYIKEGVEEIGDDAFYSNGFLKDVSIVLPTTITAIGRQGLNSMGSTHGEYGYYGYFNIICRAATPPSVGYDAIDSPDLKQLFIPKESYEKYKEHEFWGKFGTIKTIPIIEVKNADRIYGDANPSFEYTYDSEDELIGSPSVSCEADKTSSVGDYVINIDYGTITHKFYELRSGTLHINKATLQVSTKDYTIAKGEDIPTFEITYDGFKNGEDESVLTVKASASTTATNGSPTGTYPIVISGGEADNYTFDYTNGELTITETEVSRITETTANESGMKKNFYTISGVSCGETNKLGKGLYVIDGKKVLVK